MMAATVDRKIVKTGDINEYDYAYEADIETHANKISFRNQASDHDALNLLSAPTRMRSRTLT